MYADWWYAWTLTYLMGTHRDVFIVLKKSLKWVPILGWVSTAAPPPADRADSGRMYAQGMQFFNFIFLARSWASDRLELSRSLSWLARRAEKEDSPLTFILYPEGTLVSKDTRPVSKKYADKLGIVCRAPRFPIDSCIDASAAARHDAHPAAPFDGPALLAALARAPHTEPAAARHHRGLPRSAPPRVAARRGPSGLC